MKEKFIAERISQLIIQKDLSEYRVSCELGQSKGYLNKIVSGEIYPSMSAFLLMCDYFNLTPAEFFAPYPNKNMEELMKNYKELNAENKAVAEKILQALLVAQKSEEV